MVGRMTGALGQNAANENAAVGMTRRQGQDQIYVQSFIEDTRINERDFHGLELSLAVLGDMFVSIALHRNVVVTGVPK
jgi:hypothetical protein